MSKTQRKALQPITQTGRWLQAGIGAGAAIATILASAHSCGLLGAEGSRLSVTNLAVHWVGLSPGSDTAESLGDTLRFVATVTDRRGATLVGATLLWESEDSTIAVVDSAGFVVARGVGVTNVVTRVGERMAKARVLVRPRVSRLELELDSLILAEGSDRLISAMARDARGHEVRRPQLSLVSADTTVVTVRGERLLAMAPGRTTVSGMLDGVSDSLAVEVTPVPARLVAFRGSGQRALAGSRLGEPIVVRLEARSGRPMPGIAVKFAAMDGSGSVTADSVTSDERGLATTGWTLGGSPGPQHLTARVSGLDTILVVEAEAEPTASNTRITPVEDSLRGVAGGVALSAAIRVTDSVGRMLPGVPVTWSALDGGKVEARAGRTDSVGESRVEWTLGNRSGGQRLRAVVGTGRTVPPRILTAVALPRDPARLELVGTARREGVAGRLLAASIAVRVTDSLGNPVPDVRLTVAPDSGTVPESTIVSDAAGRAAIRWTLGRAAGEQHLTISAPRLKPVTVLATARAGTAANLTLSGNPATAPAGKRLAKAIRVLVTDVYGNPIPDQLLSIQPSAGSASPSRAMTDKSGSASVTWTLGSRPGVQRLLASVSKTAVKQSIEIEATKRR